MRPQVPPLRTEDIRPYVDDLRARHQILNEFPVDVELFADELGISILPELNLKADIDAEAFISLDFKLIIVDFQGYNDEKKHIQNRLRFSLAHEIGHKVLHQDFFENNRGQNDGENGCLDIIRLLNNGQRNLLERQANDFAGMLLVPAEELVQQALQRNGDINRTRLAAYFGVSAAPIDIRIKASDVRDELRKNGIMV